MGQKFCLVESLGKSRKHNKKIHQRYLFLNIGNFLIDWNTDRKLQVLLKTQIWKNIFWKIIAIKKKIQKFRLFDNFRKVEMLVIFNIPTIVIFRSIIFNRDELK